MKLFSLVRNNISLKLAALAIAFIIWLVVGKIDNPVISKVFGSVPVTIENGPYVESSGKTYRLDTDYQTVSVTIKGRKSVVQGKDNKSITAVADLTQIVDMDTTPVMVPVTVSCSGITADNITVNPVNIPVEIEERESKDFMISVSYGDTLPGEGFEVGRTTANPEKVSITGPESIINKIDRVVALVDVTGLTRDSVRTAELTVYDKNGDVLSEQEMSYITLGTDREVEVALELWKTVGGITFDLATTGNPDAGYEVSELIPTPSEITLAGSDVALDLLAQQGNVITIPPELINVEGLSSTVDVKVELSDLLPADTRPARNGVDSMIVQVNVIPFGSRQYTLDTTRIKVTNKPKDMELVYAVPTLTLTIKGRRAALDGLKTENIRAVIDLSGQKEGTFDVPVAVELPEGLTMTGEVAVSVSLSRLVTEPKEGN